jgi:hypothetical protein
MGGYNKFHLKETACDSVDWNRLAQDRDQWWAVITIVMILQVL